MRSLVSVFLNIKFAILWAAILWIAYSLTPASFFVACGIAFITYHVAKFVYKRFERADNARLERLRREQFERFSPERLAEKERLERLEELIKKPRKSIERQPSNERLKLARERLEKAAAYPQTKAFTNSVTKP